MTHAALSLGTEEGIKELQRFVHNAPGDGRRKGKTLANIDTVLHFIKLTASDKGKEAYDAQ